MSEKEKERNANQHTQRERARNFFHEILALLVTKSYKKLKVQNSEENFPHFAVTKMFKEHFLPLHFCHVTHPQDLKLSWPVLIVKLKKDSKTANKITKKN